MQFSVVLVSIMASCTLAAPVAYLQMGREPTGKLAVKVRWTERRLNSSKQNLSNDLWAEYCASRRYPGARHIVYHAARPL